MAMQKTKDAASIVITQTASPTNEAVTAAPATAVHAPGRDPIRDAPNVINSLKHNPAASATISANSQSGEWSVTAMTNGMPMMAVRTRFIRY
jgi:hypothetical protein